MAPLVVAATAFGIWWFVEQGWSRSPGEAQPPRIEVHFKRSQNDRTYDVLSETTVPLPTGSLIQVHADLGRLGYPYLFGLSANEPPVLLHPGEVEPARPVRDFWSPALAAEGKTQQWHRLNPPAGSVMLLLLVADAPVGDLDRLVSQLKDLRCPEIDKFALLEGDPDAPLLHWNRSRGSEPRAAEAPKGLLRTVPEGWRSRFRSVRILTFSHEANATSSVGAQP